MREFMRKYLLLIPTLSCLLLVGCQNGDKQNILADNSYQYQNGNQNTQDSDDNITSRVRAAINRDDNLSTATRNNISVSTVNGVVTLQGTVQNRDEMDMAVNDAQGVVTKRVINKLQISRYPRNN